jgi:hypothetical protein
MEAGGKQDITIMADQNVTGNVMPVTASLPGIQESTVYTQLAKYTESLRVSGSI